MVSDVGDVMALGRHFPKCPTVAKRQPVHLSPRYGQPQGHSVSIPPHLQPLPVPGHGARELPVSAVWEVVQEVSRDQVLGVQVGAILSRKKDNVNLCKHSVKILCAYISLWTQSHAFFSVKTLNNIRRFFTFKQWQPMSVVCCTWLKR